jgi:hypothetical protein
LGGVALADTAPAWSSRPEAPATLLIDFDGIDYGSGTWGGGTPGTQPAFSRDADTSTFSQEDVDSMFLMWSAVSEMYSPFNLNVTTVDPGSFDRRVATRVVVSGNGSWYGSAGGVAYLGGFTTNDDDPRWRTGWAFEDNYGGNMIGLAETIAHESGHQFGLRHQSLFDQNGNNIDTYRDTQDGGYTDPIMGGHYQAVRSLWSDGPAQIGGGPVQQLDLSLLASTQTNPYDSYWNGFGYREDDWGDVVAEAGEMDVDELTLVASGVIEQTTDVDVFRFSSTGGTVDIEVDGALHGQMLDIRLDLFDSAASHLFTDNPPLSLTSADDFGLDAAFSGFLTAGDYFLAISSNGAYGDVGQYFITAGGAIAIPEPAAAGLLLLGGLGLLRRQRSREV